MNTRIRTAMDQYGIRDVSPTTIEAFMRVEHTTLDGISKSEFEAEVIIYARTARKDPNLAASLARQFGF